MVLVKLYKAQSTAANAMHLSFSLSLLFRHEPQMTEMVDIHVITSEELTCLKYKLQVQVHTVYGNVKVKPLNMRAS